MELFKKDIVPATYAAFYMFYYDRFAVLGKCMNNSATSLRLHLQKLNIRDKTAIANKMQSGKDPFTAKSYYLCKPKNERR